MKILYDSLWSIYSHTVDLSSILHRGSFGGEMARKQGRDQTENGELKNQGHAGDDGKGQKGLFFPLPCVPKRFLFPSVPSSRALYFLSPHSPAYRKGERDLCGGERDLSENLFWSRKNHATVQCTPCIIIPQISVLPIFVLGVK